MRRPDDDRSSAVEPYPNPHPRFNRGHDARVSVYHGVFTKKHQFPGRGCYDSHRTPSTPRGQEKYLHIFLRKSCKRTVGSSWYARSIPDPLRTPPAPEIFATPPSRSTSAIIDLARRPTTPNFSSNRSFSRIRSAFKTPSRKSRIN